MIAGSLRQFQEGGRIRALAEERDSAARQLAALPTDCPVCGDPAAWLQDEKEQKREQERAESAIRSAQREMDSLEARIDAWPWQYSRNQRKDWLRSARPGELAYSRQHGWMVYLGPSTTGLGSFIIDGTVKLLDSYANLDYLPDPPLAVQVPNSAAAGERSARWGRRGDHRTGNEGDRPAPWPG